MSQTTELTTIEAIALPVKFATQEVTDAIAKIRAAALAEAEGLDVSRPRDRDSMRSIAYRVAKSKTAMEKLAKGLSDRRKAEIADEVNAIMAERKRIETELDELRDQIKEPAERFDAREKERIAGHEDAISEIEEIGRFENGMTGITYRPDADTIRGRIAQLDALPPRNWQEFEDRATKLISITREDLQFRLAAQIKSDTDAAELARLQAEEIARKQRERDATIARIAAEQAAREAEALAEEKRQAEAARVEAEREAFLARERREREAIEAAAQAERDAASARERAMAEQIAAAEEQRKQAELDRIASENAARVAAEKADRDRIAAEQRAEAERIATAERAQREQAAAIEAERQRVAKIAADEEAERKRREADKEHRGKVNAAARDAIMDAIGEFTSTSASEANKIAEAVVKAIAIGRVPGVSISY